MAWQTNGNLTTTSDNVGIGTASPGSSLDVRGTVSVRGNGDLYFHRDDGFSGGSSIVLDPPGAGTSDLTIQRSGGGTIAGFHVEAAVSTFTGGLELDIPAAGNPINAISVDVQSFLTFANSQASSFLQVRDIGAAPPGGFTHFIVRGDGNVGIATSQPAARLSVVSPPGTTEITGSAASTTLRISSGTLGQTPGTYAVAASFGAIVDTNNVSLGVRIRNGQPGQGWTGSIIALSMDVDNTLGAGGSLLFFSKAISDLFME
ncbi:hypothetical protein [Alloacidobacterium sp.]|uniref:hypothetical protein n=1 Tax=Alloacidobacterium sp. TaxID=2951999 RepID=UPI002D22228C|nr:hypothetical protein [Alloacidobacterium sp.]HYK35317.1 hypothetical protein [Alloacidobacterium sp.]